MRRVDEERGNLFGLGVVLHDEEISIPQIVILLASL